MQRLIMRNLCCGARRRPQPERLARRARRGNISLSTLEARMGDGPDGEENMKTTTLAFGLAMALAAGAASAEPAMKVAIHVDEQDIQTMVMALNNAANIQKYYADKGEEVQIEIVAYGPGLHMFRKDTSPVADRIEMMAMESDSIAFSACLNTVESMERKEDKDVPLLDEVAVTPSGAVRLIELQKEGWTYLRP